MAHLVWDAEGTRTYETGTDRGVLYPWDSTKNGYGDGVAWNGLTGVSESPSGAEATALWADNIKYLNLMSTEEFGATVTCYTYPDEWAECDGSAKLNNLSGIYIGQQPRKTFGLSYRTLIGNDTESNNHGYVIHLVYGCVASPSQKDYKTVNDSPEAIEFSYEIKTTPVNVTGGKPTATVRIDSTVVDSTKLTKVEGILYGTDPTTDPVSAGTAPTLLLPDDVAREFAAG